LSLWIPTPVRVALVGVTNPLHQRQRVRVQLPRTLDGLALRGRERHLPAAGAGLDRPLAQLSLSEFVRSWADAANAGDVERRFWILSFSLLNHLVLCLPGDNRSLAAFLGCTKSSAVSRFDEDDIL
jgi:hypothetical protein